MPRVAPAVAEKLSTDLYNRHFDRLYDIYDRQELVQRTFAVFSPTISLQPWSRAFAGTDFGAHLNYSRGVEDYRYRLIQTLNVEIKDHKPPPGERYYLADIATITRDVAYAPRQLSMGDVAAAQIPNLVILLVWTAFAISLVAVSARRLGRLS